MSNSRNDRNALYAGLFILAAAFAVVAVIVTLKGAGRFIEPQQTRVAVFELNDDLGGLANGDDVRLGGLKVGTVQHIDFVAGPQGRPQLAVTFTLPQRIELRPGAVLRIQTTVTGSSNLNIESLGEGRIADVAPAPADALAGNPDNLSQLLGQLGQLAPDLRTITLPKANHALDKAGEMFTTFKGAGESATDLVGHVKEKVNPIVERYNTLTDRGTQALGNISDLFGDTKADFRTTVANLKDTTGSFKERVPSILAKLDAAIESTNAALEDVKRIGASTRDTADVVRRVLVENRGKLDSMIESLKRTGDNLKSASAEIRHSPWRLLYQPKQGELANLNLYDSTRQFAEGAGALHESALALRDALSNPQADPDQIQKLMQALETSFAGFNQVEQELWEKVRE